MNIPSTAYRGYWVEPFLDIIRGKALSDQEGFQKCAQILYNHRASGNPIVNNTLTDESLRQEAIQELHISYCSLSEETDLAKRAVLLNTVFMQTLAENLKCPLNQEQKKYVTRLSIWGALKACESENILEIKSYKEWLKSYRLGCSTIDSIEEHAALYAGYSKEEAYELSLKRLSVSQIWYPAYKAGKVTKSALRILLLALQNYQDPTVNVSVKQEDDVIVMNAEEDQWHIKISNPFMLAAFNAYIKHAKDFSEEKQEIYWKAIFKALQKFILNAN